MNNRLTIGLILAGLVAGIVLIAMFGWMPLLSDLASKRVDLETAEQAILTERSRQQALLSLSSQREELTDSVSVMEQGYMLLDDELEVVLQLEEITGRTGSVMTIEFLESMPSLVPQTRGATSDEASGLRVDPLVSYVSVPVEIQLTGSYTSIVRTIEEIEGMPLHNELVRVDLVRTSQIPGMTDAQPIATVLARFFVLPAS